MNHTALDEGVPRRGETRRREPDDGDHLAASVMSGYLTEALWQRGGLRIGVVCDISGSMTEHADQVATLAWIIQRAASHARSCFPGPSHFPVETFALHADPAAPFLLGPLVENTTPIPALVIGGNPKIGRASDRVAFLADLAAPYGARLLVLVTDNVDWRPGGLPLVELRRLGCGVLCVHSPDAARSENTNPAATFQLDPRDSLDHIRRLGAAMRDEIDHAESAQPPAQPGTDQTAQNGGRDE